ncbi:hypothetical protein ACLB2K_022278 [Fragaria x ananassa]
MGGLGFVIRDFSGHMSAGGASPLTGLLSVEHAKLLACSRAFDVALEHGYHSVILETDAQDVQKQFNEYQISNPTSATSFTAAGNQHCSSTSSFSEPPHPTPAADPKRYAARQTSSSSPVLSFSGDDVAKLPPATTSRLLDWANEQVHRQPLPPPPWPDQRRRVRGEGGEAVLMREVYGEGRCMVKE